MSEEFNSARITGIIEDEFEYSHTVKGIDFYRTRVGVKRISGTIDHVPVMVTNVMIPNICEKYFKGEQVQIKGEFRGYNKLGEDEKYHLILLLYVKETIFFGKGKWEDVVADDNYIVLDGYVCKKPIFRETLTGTTLTEVMLAVKRNFYKTDYIPCICWNGVALSARNLEVGDRIQLRGRIQSREYLKRHSPDSEEGEIKTAYEVSCISFKKI